ncbi:MAG: immunoglobulin-like domain-containing protein, partial [Clostridia bacterium]
MLKKKCMSFFLAMLMVLSTVIFSAGTVAAETSSAMTVAANDSELAVKTEFSAEQDHVQRVGNLFRPLNDPARTSNNPVDFGQTYLVAEDDTDLWTIDTRITGDTQNTQDEATPFMINGSYIGANHGQNSGMYVTVTGHGLGYADVGSRWTTTVAAEESDPVTINWNLLRIVDENTLLFLSDGTFQKGAYTYGFSTQLSASDTMTRVGSAGSLTVESVTVNQVFPSIRHTKKTAYAVSGGLKWKIEPNTSYDCDYVVIEESYQIIDPSTIAEAVRANAPTGGYTANPDLTVGGEAMMNYNVVYTLLPDGTVLTEVNHEVLKAIRIDSYGLLQYPKRTDYAGGGIYRYLPNTKSFEARAVGQAASETTGFDFSVPTKIIGEDAAAYPNSYVYRNADCVDTSYPNERTIDFFSDGSKDAATFASGYLPVGMGAKDKLAGIRSGFYFYSSYKAYPRIYQSAMQDGPGTILFGVGYKKLYAGGRSDNMNVYTVPYGDTLYTYVDMFATGKSYTLPAGYAVVNQSANVTISAGVATANFAEGDTHGYLVVSSANTEAASSVTAASVLAQLTKESISSEPLDFVTKNLIIPEMMSDTGVTLTWESSNENVISANGTVTRPTLAAETVTLKAIATDGSGSQEKSFTVTVAPLTVKEVSTNDNFASGLSNWSSSNLPGTIAGDDSNHYASFAANTTSGYPTASAALPALTSLGGTGTYTVEYKIKLPSTTTAGEIARVDLKANNKVISSIALMSGKLMIVVKGQTWYSTNAASNGSYTAGNWATFKTII